MDPFTLALLGTTAVTGLGSLFGSNKANKAQQAALVAAQQQLAQSRAAALESAGTGYNDALKYAAEGRDSALGYAAEGRDSAIKARENYLTPALAEYTPIVESGDRARTAYETATGLLGREAQQQYYDDFLTDPGFQSEVDAGIRALDRSAAARGGSVASGGALAALQRYGQTMQHDAYTQRLGQIDALRTSGDAARSARAGLYDSAGRDIAGYHTNYGNTASGIAGNYGNLTAGLASDYGRTRASLESGYGENIANSYLQTGQMKANNAMAPWNALTTASGNALKAYGGRLGTATR